MPNYAYSQSNIAFIIAFVFLLLSQQGILYSTHSPYSYCMLIIQWQTLEWHTLQEWLTQGNIRENLKSDKNQKNIEEKKSLNTIIIS